MYSISSNNQIKSTENTIQKKYETIWIMVKLENAKLRAHENMWYAMTPSPASLTRTVRSFRRAEYNFAERSYMYRLRKKIPSFFMLRI